MFSHHRLRCICHVDPIFANSHRDAAPFSPDITDNLSAVPRPCATSQLLTQKKIKVSSSLPWGSVLWELQPPLPTDPDPASLVRVISFLWLPLSSAPPLPHCCLAASVLHKLPSLKWEEGWKRCPLLKAECCGKQTFSPRAQQQQLSASVLMMNHPGLRVDQSAGLMCYVAECRGDGSTCSIMDLRPNLTSASVT